MASVWVLTGRMVPAADWVDWVREKYAPPPLPRLL